MKVGYLTSQYPAPSHTFIRREVEAVRASGIEVATYSVRPAPGGLGSELDRAAQAETFVILHQSAGAFLGTQLKEILRAPGRYLSTLRLALRHRVPGAKALVWAGLHFAEAMLLARRLRRDGITHLHNHFANPAATVGLLAANQLGISWSMTLHGISEFDYPAGNLLAAKLERATFAACVSHFGMAQAMRLTSPAIWPKLELARCAIDPALLPASPTNPDEEGPVEIVCVGRLSPEKGQSGLLDAFDRLRGRVEARLTLVGDGPEQARLEEQVRALRLGEHVRFAGRLDERATLDAIAGSDLLVLPSFMEGLPVVLIEAMALGVPVVASRVAGIPELVEHDVTGLLFTPADWRGLEDAMVRLASDPELRRSLAERGREQAASGFFYPAAARPLIDRFRSLAPIQPAKAGSVG